MRPAPVIPDADYKVEPDYYPLLVTALKNSL